MSTCYFSSLFIFTLLDLHTFLSEVTKFRTPQIARNQLLSILGSMSSVESLAYLLNKIEALPQNFVRAFKADLEDTCFGFLDEIQDNIVSNMSRLILTNDECLDVIGLEGEQLNNLVACLAGSSNKMAMQLAFTDDVNPSGDTLLELLCLVDSHCSDKAL